MVEDKDVVVKVEHVSKKFSKSLKRAMLYGTADISRNAFGMGTHPEKLRKGEFWAVDDVSFELRKGEALGLIGPNGSGKSTLLKMLNGIYWPDKGKITIKGRVGALIEVGAGFSPMLTGRENIYINAAILGMHRKETDAKLDDIIKFADIGDFLDSPVKYYSSGMYVRLGFAVAVHCEPDVLLVDEVLAVGDENFKLKCLSLINRIIDSTSVIFVSHSMPYVARICSTAVLMEHGKVTINGDVNSVINSYMGTTTRPEPITYVETSENRIENYSIINGIKENDSYILIEYGGSMQLEFDLLAHMKHKQLEVAITIFNQQLDPLLNITESTNRVFIENRGHNHVKVTVPKLVLGPGTYSIGVNVFDTATKELICKYSHILQFHITTKDMVHCHIPVRQDGVWEISKL